MYTVAERTSTQGPPQRMLAAAGGTDAIVWRVQCRLKAQGSVESREARIAPSEVEVAAAAATRSTLLCNIGGPLRRPGRANRTMARTKRGVRAGQSKRYIAVAHSRDVSPMGGEGSSGEGGGAGRWVYSTNTTTR